MGALSVGRLRSREATRRLIRETRLSADQLVMPLFVRPGTRTREPIPSLPGQSRLSADEAGKAARALAAAGVPAVLLFGLPGRRAKDGRARAASARTGVVQEAVRAIKARAPGLLVITDVCLCAYTDHGHCGVLKGTGHRGQGTGKARVAIDQEATLEVLGEIAVSHAQAGADMVAPSDMTDGNVGAVRRALNRSGFASRPIMAYSAKYASSLYAPFRQAVDCAPAFGDRRSYQLDPANAEEALREARQDIEEGADLIMVKPAFGYLDVLWRLKRALRHPVAAFNVSGEYAMVKAAAARGWIVEELVWWELLQGLARAGADVIITYWAREAAQRLEGGKGRKRAREGG
jgi:porphobilinogen synthase